jgi:beta-galactosidase
MPYILLNAASAVSAQVLRSGQWSHLAGTYDGSDLTIYVDGVPMQKAPLVGSPPNTTAPAMIGQAWNATRFMNGRIDEVAIHNRALRPEEVLDHYRSGAVTMKFQ